MRISWIASGGTVTAGGLYTAPNVPGTYTVSADVLDTTNNQQLYFYPSVNVAAPSGSTGSPSGASSPTNVQISSLQQAIQLSWDDSATGVDRLGWNVYRLDTQTNQYVKLNTSLITSVLGYNDMAAPLHQLDTYRVTMVTTDGESAPVTVSVWRASAPTNLVGRPTVSGTIDLNWLAPVADINYAAGSLQSYNIYRWNTSLGAYVKVGNVSSSQTSFMDTGLSALTSYQYVVSAVDSSDDESSFSLSVTVETGATGSVGVPASVSANATSSSSVHLAWSAPTGSPAATGYVLYRGTTADGPFVQIASTSSSSFDDTTLSSTTHYYYEVRAVDSAGDLSAFVAVDAVTASVASAAPFVSITSPTTLQLVTGSLDVNGIVDDPNNDLIGWTLVLHPTSDIGLSDIVVAQGTAEEGDESTGTDSYLGTIQASLVPDGEYTLVLKATDAAANSVATTDGPQIQIQADQKLGDLTFSVADLTIPMPNGSLQITRTYDSIDRYLNGSMGYGWQLNIDAQVDEVSTSRHNVATNFEDDSEGEGTVSVRDPGSRDVYVTLPTGQRVRFDFSPADESEMEYNGNDVQATFTPEGQSFGATLSLLPEQQTIHEGTNELSTASFPYFEDHEMATDDPSADLFEMEDIRGYILTTSDGTKYVFEKSESTDTIDGPRYLSLDGDPYSDTPVVVYHLYTGAPTLSEIIDPHGNKIDLTTLAGGDTLLAITPSGSPSATQYVRITRNSAKQATALINNVNSSGDYGEEIVDYVYDSNDNLTFVHQKTQDAQTLDGIDMSEKWVTTKYQYDTSSNLLLDHSLMKAYAPIDVDRDTSSTDFVTTLSATYDSQNGMLLTLTDASGNVTTFGTNLTSRIEVVADARGLDTIYQYDADGNVLFETSPTGAVTAYTYFPNTHNVQSETDDYGTRNANGTVISNPDAITHYYTYDSLDAQSSDTYTYIPDGQTSSVTITTITGYIDINGEHLVQYSTDATGVATINDYDPKTGNLLETDVYQSIAVVAGALSPGKLLQKTTYDAYDAAGNVLSTTQWAQDAIGWYRVSKTVNWYINETYLAGTRTYGFDQKYYANLSDYNDQLYPDDNSNADGLILMQLTTMVYNGEDLQTSYQWINASGWYPYDPTSYTYDLQHRVISTTDARGHTSYTFYTDSGQTDYTTDALGAVTKYIYNSQGQTVEVRTAANLAALNAGAYTSEFTTYTADGKVKTSTDALGNVTTNYYDAAGDLVQTLNSDGTSMETLYDAYGRAIYATDRHVIGQPADATRYTYDALGQQTLTERVSNVLINVAQVTGTLASPQVDVYAATLSTAGAVFSSSGTHYDIFGRIDYTTDANGHQTFTYYNAAGQVREVVEPAVSILNPTTGLVEQVTPTTDYQYDALGRQIEVIAPATWVKNASGTWALVRAITQTQYDALGRVTSTIYADGSHVDTRYDSLGRKTSQSVQYKDGEDPRWTYYDYDAAGNLTDVYQPVVANVSSLPTTVQIIVDGVTYTGGWYQAYYDSFADGGLLDEIYLSPGAGGAWYIDFVQYSDDYHDWGYELTGTGNSLSGATGLDYSTWSNDPADTVPFSSFQLIVGSETYTFYTQDASMEQSGISADPFVQPHTQYTYDAAGNELSETDANGDTTQFTYNSLGQELTHTLPGGEQETFTYNQQGQELTHTDFDGNVASFSYYTVAETDLVITDGSATYTMVWTNDASAATGFSDSSGWVGFINGDRYAWIQTPDLDGTGIFDLVNASGSQSPLGDDAVGSAANFLTQIANSLSGEGILGDNVTVATILHPVGALKQIVSVGAPYSGKATQTVTYTYDELGRQKTVTDASGTTTDHYDAQGNLIEKDTPEGTIHYVFDPATGEETETYTDFTDTVYGYDALGRLSITTVTKLNGTTLSTRLVTTYTYDASGNKHTETLPDGEVTTYAYDELNRLVSVLEMQGTTQILSQTYVLNTDGTRQSLHQVQREISIHGPNITTDTTYGYDSLDRLVSETYTSSIASENYSHVFTYDLVGNRATDTHTYIPPGSSSATTDFVVYAYNADDELTTQITNWSDVNDIDYLYDANGSQVAVIENDNWGSPTSLYAYDVRNKMVSFTDSSGNTTTYVYDDAGNRVQEGGTNGSSYLTDTQNPTGYVQPLEVHSTINGYLAMTYLIGDHVFGQYSAIGLNYLLTDGHGSTVFITTSTGTVSKDFRYDAFGNPINFAANTAGTIFLFGGDSVYDPVSGLSMHGDGTRDRLGFTFLQRDIYAGNLQDPLSLHKYLYVDGDPVNAWDASGDFIFTLIGSNWAYGKFVHDEIGLDFLAKGVVVCSPKLVPPDMRVSNRPQRPEGTLDERQEAHPRTDHRQAA